jgi:hypothetical protein
MAGGEYGNQRHEAALRRDRVVELRDQGLTFKEIGEIVGRDTADAWRDYQRAMRDRPVVAAHAERDQARKEAQLRRIDMERETAEAIILTAHTAYAVNGTKLEGDDSAPVLAAMDRLVKLDDQEAKLLGLYAKTEINHSGAVTYEIRGVDMSKVV